MGGMLTGDFSFDNYFWLHRLQTAFKAWHSATGGSAIELHLYGTDAQLDEPDKVLIVRALDEVQRAFPELKGSFVQGAVRSNSKNHPEFRVPTNESLHVQTAWANVWACGDWVGHPTGALWMERACVTAVAAANHVLQSEGLETYEILEPKGAGGLARCLGALVRGGRRVLTPVIRDMTRALRGRKTTT
jgi:hypothetical protein